MKHLRNFIIVLLAMVFLVATPSIIRWVSGNYVRENRDPFKRERDSLSSVIKLKTLLLESSAKNRMRLESEINIHKLKYDSLLQADKKIHIHYIQEINRIHKMNNQQLQDEMYIIYRSFNGGGPEI